MIDCARAENDHCVTSASDLRIRACNDAPSHPEGAYVLYWMIAARRLGWNFALDRALDWCRRLGKPLVIFEPVRCGYRWASDRIHRFVLDGMAEQAAALAGAEVLYYPYVEPSRGAGKGLLAALAARAAVVVTDEFPCFFLPRMVAAAARQLPVLLEAVDSNGLLPLRAADREFTAAYHFRRFLQRTLPAHLGDRPAATPLRAPLGFGKASLSKEVRERWPPAAKALLAGGSLAVLPIDHSVAPVSSVLGGESAGRAALDRFLDERLGRYAEGRNDSVEEVTSGLSPYLHFGHVGAHQLFAALADREGWSPDRLGDGARGAREGWWGMSAAAERFLDEAIVWREIGFNLASRRADYDRFDSLPAWALATLGKHARDRREELYSPEEFAAGATADPLWNAAQGQLVAEGKIHNYLRMLWGKKVLQWSPSPRAAADLLIELNNRYALDGRDPSSYTGIFWCFGRYDRPWAPERPIFGTVRYMSSDSARRKYRVDAYVRRYAPERRAAGAAMRVKASQRAPL